MASHRRGPWSQAEDAYLVQLVHTQGALNWVRIAQLIEGRSPKQCRERYHQALKPSVNHEPISPEEGLQIERMVGEMGKRWAEIASRLNGRSDNAVKNWWNGSMNRRRHLVLQGTPPDDYTLSPATVDSNPNTQTAIHTPNYYPKTHLPALQSPQDYGWEAKMRAEKNQISGELNAQQQQPQATPQHKRVYQACIPCRRRKVKCDMGSVDNAHDPPCVRCRRESKECFFSNTERERKHNDDGPDSLDSYEYDDNTVRKGRKMAHTSPSASVRQSSMGAPTSARSPMQYGDNTYMSNIDQAILSTMPTQRPRLPLTGYLRTAWNGSPMSVDGIDEAAAESHEQLHDNSTVFSKDSGYKSTKSMPNSNAFTFRGSKPVLWNTQNGVDDSQSLGAGQAEEEPRQALSDMSHDSGFSGTTLSGLGKAEVNGAPQELAEILANHPELRPLILQASEEMDPRRFDKVFIRLLRTCAIDLREEAKTQLEKGAVRIIYNYRAYATSLIRDEFTSRGHEKVLAMNRLKFQKIEDKMKLESFIENYQQKSTEKQDIQMIEDEEEDDKLSMGSDYNDPDEPDLRNLRKVRGFITSSAAFSNLKSNLEDFLMPMLDGKEPVTATLQTSMEDIQWHPATADRRSSTKRKSAGNGEEMLRQAKWPRLDESNNEKTLFTLDADGEGADIEGDIFGTVSVVRQPITFLRPPDYSVNIDVSMKDLDIEHQAESQLQEIGHSNSKDACSSSKRLGNTPDPKCHPQPSELPALTTSHHLSLEQKTANKLHDMKVLGTPTSIGTSKGKGKPASVDAVNEESVRILQKTAQAGSSSMGAQSLDIMRPTLATDNLSLSEEEKFSSQWSVLRDPVKTNIDCQLVQHRPLPSTSQKMWGLLKRRWRPPVRPGHKRLEWVCGCGDSLYADLQDDGGQTLAKLSAILTCPTTAAPSSNPGSQAQSLTPMQPVHQSSFSISSAHISQHSLTRCHLNQSNINHISHGLLQPPLSSARSKRPQFLELCVNSGEYLKVLGEIPTGNISSDQELFRSIKTKYLELRGFRARFWLLKPSAVNYVHISVENCHRVGILEKPCALPPKVEVDAKRYIYDPCPLIGGVPIPDHIFLHYMNCPNPLSKDAWLERLPKKLGTSITHNAPAVTYGWGVHIDEGPNYGVIAWVNFFVLLLSGAAAALWSFYRKDFQGAFGFSSWIIAVLNSLMIGYFFRWKNE